MKILKKSVVIILISIFLLLPIVNSATIVEVPTQQQPAQETNVFASSMAFFKTSFFKWFIIISLLVIALGVITFFVVRWIVRFIKLRSDIFWQLKSKRIRLARVHKTYPSKKWLKFKKNTPIRLVKKDKDGKAFVTNPIAYHKGDYTTHEGNVIISFNMTGNRMWYIFPITELLIIPNKTKLELVQHDKEGKRIEKIIEKIPTAKDIIQFNENEILIYAESISNIGQFFVPVLKSKDGKIIDLSMPIYDSLKEVVLGDFLYEQTDEFSKVAKKSIDLNPNLRYATKMSDTNQSVELPNVNK